MTTPQDGQVVTVNYTGKLQDGTVFDSTQQRDPFQFKLGEDNVIPGFEQAVRVMEPGDVKTVAIPPELAYGERHQENVVQITPQQIPDNMDVQVGQRLELRQQDGRNIPVTVTEVQDDAITLDANHPLAGETLIFDIELVSVG